MPRLTNRERFLRDNPDFYREIRKKRTAYPPHAGQFTSETAKKALEKRYSEPSGKEPKDLQYIGFVCISATGYVFRKFKVPIRRKTRGVHNFSAGELRTMALKADQAAMEQFNKEGNGDIDSDPQE